MFCLFVSEPDDVSFVQWLTFPHSEDNDHDDGDDDSDDDYDGDRANDDDDNFVQWTQFSLPHNPGCPRALARTRITQKYSS